MVVLVQVLIYDFDVHHGKPLLWPLHYAHP